MSCESWTQRKYSSSVGLRNVPIGKLGLPICGGAEQGEFLRIGSVYQFQIEYNFGIDVLAHKWIQHPPPGRALHEGDIILETGRWSAAGLRRREYLGLVDNLPDFYCSLTCVRAGDLPVSLRDFLRADYPLGDANHDLQNKVRQNLLKVSPPLTTRIPRLEETDGVEYSFVTFNSIFKMERDGHLLQFEEYNGNYYGIQKPDLNNQVASKAAIKEFKSRPSIKRSESFRRAFEISSDNFFEELSKKKDSSSSLRNSIIRRKPGHTKDRVLS